MKYCAVAHRPNHLYGFLVALIAVFIFVTPKETRSEVTVSEKKELK